MKKVLFLFFTVFLFSCTISYPDLKKAEISSKKIIESLQSNDWETIWLESSTTYKHKISSERFFRLKKWVNNELGKIKIYKRTYFYTGSSFSLTGENYVKIHYEANFTKGIGQIEMTLVQENKDFKISSFEFIKKPSY